MMKKEERKKERKKEEEEEEFLAQPIPVTVLAPPNAHARPGIIYAVRALALSPPHSDNV